jgi:hypothetical protein
MTNAEFLLKIMEIKGCDIKEAWQQAAFLHGLPTICPVDQSPTRFGYSKIEKDEFYTIESTPQDDKTPVYQFHFGTRQADQKLFPGKMDETAGKAVQRWVYWDSEKRTQVVVWENGRLLGRQPVAMETVQTASIRTAPVELTAHQQKLAEFDQLGIQIYSTQWPEVRKHNTIRISEMEFADPASLTDDQLQRLITGMRSLVNKRQQGGK